jgi:hypothetical protein
MKPRVIARRTAHALFGVLVSGCGAAGVGEVSGTVSVRGQPVVYGTVTLVGGDGAPHAGAIQPDGRYTVTGVPAGSVRIAVVSPPVPRVESKLDVPSDIDPEQYKALEQERAAAATRVAGIDRKMWHAIDKKYADFNTSGLTVVVASGANPYDIDLK